MVLRCRKVIRNQNGPSPFPALLIDITNCCLGRSPNSGSFGTSTGRSHRHRTAREENLQDVPIAITAIGAEELRVAGISDLNTISLRTPGFSMSSFNQSQRQLFIRGVGSNADGASEGASVVIFLDGVYLARTAGQTFDRRSVTAALI